MGSSFGLFALTLLVLVKKVQTQKIDVHVIFCRLVPGLQRSSQAAWAQPTEFLRN